MAARYAAVLFDLLTGLLDSLSLWDAVARDEGTGRGERPTFDGSLRPLTAAVLG